MKEKDKLKKSAWFYIAIIIGMCLLFAILLFVVAFIYSANTGDKQFLRDLFGVAVQS
jgi:hypothetical protein